MPEMSDSERARLNALFDQGDALAAWAEFERKIKARGWYVLCSEYGVQVCMPGKAPQQDRYIEVFEL